MGFRLRHVGILLEVHVVVSLIEDNMSSQLCSLLNVEYLVTFEDIGQYLMNMCYCGICSFDVHMTTQTNKYGCFG